MNRARLRHAPGARAGRGLLLLALLAPAPLRAEPHPALTSLVPLIEVFDARKDTPAFDVAGIRCAGLYLARQDWARRKGDAAPPSAAELADIERNLTLAEQQRRNDGLNLVDAQETTRADVLRVMALYSARFAANAAGGGHPWQADRVIAGDSTYCGYLGGRK